MREANLEKLSATEREARVSAIPQDMPAGSRAVRGDFICWALVQLRISP